METKRTLELEFSYQGQASRLESTVAKCKIGRSPVCEFSLPQVHVISREHLIVEMRENTVWITDLNSSNGSYYNEVRLTPQVAYEYSGGTLYLGTPDQGLRIHISLIRPAENTEVEALPFFEMPVKEKQEREIEKSAVHEFVPHPSIEIEGLSPKLAPGLDQNLMQMQVAEEELAALAAKRSVLQDDIDRLSARESEFKQVELDFKSHQACLILMKEELISVQACANSKKNEIVQMDLELDATDAQLKNSTALALLKSRELDEGFKFLSEQETAILLAEMKLKEWANLASEKAAEVDQANATVERLDVITKAFQSEQASYANSIKVSQDCVAGVEVILSELEMARIQAERKHHDLRVQEKIQVQNLELFMGKVALEMQNADEQLKEFEKKAKLEQETSEATASLRRMKLEREVEEAITRRILAERDGDDAKRRELEAQSGLSALITEHELWIKKIGIEKNSVDQIKHHSEKLNVEIGQEEDRLRNLKLEQKELDRSILAQAMTSRAESENILSTAESKRDQLLNECKIKIAEEKLEFEKEKSSLEAAHAHSIAEFHAESEAMRLHTEELKKQDLEKFQKAQAIDREALEHSQSEIRLSQEKHAQYLADLEKERCSREQDQQDQKLLFKVQSEEASRRAHQAHDLTVASLKEAAGELRQQQAEELRLWSVQEDSRIKTLAAKNASSFAHHVAMRALAEHQRESTVSVPVLVATLEKRIVEALNGQVQGEGIYNPGFKQGVRKFWMQAAGATSAAAILLAGVQYGPRILGRKLEIMKVANQQEDARFMLEMKMQRERMLALNLQARDDFQEFYVDNVLYNPSYLAMKLDPEIQKQWTVTLSQFFFKELLFDDRKVVEYMPIEASLLSSLNENFKVLNSQNFAVNFEKMKKIEQEKSESMWLLVGGRENWTKLRKKEAEFYSKHVSSLPQASRLPSGK